jgi:hypothetical protein|tara:strand:+ start:641 stop:1837 length:1197 start_codon:yes stop_codon:yes gene_type:complete
LNSNDNDEITKFVIQSYLHILERDPDPTGLSHYVDQIINNKISKEEFHSILFNSVEYSELKNKKTLVEKINKNLGDILLNNDTNLNLKNNISSEPSSIIVSCHDRSTGAGGLFFLNDNKLEKIYDEKGCFGIFYDKTRKIVFSVTEGQSQIIAFKLKSNNEYSSIKINFLNYIFSEAPHSIFIFNDKLYVVATDGETDSKKSTNTLGSHKKIGKIIVSDIDFQTDSIVIKNSKSFNPFSCSHHHHYNDICEYGGNLYLSSFSYCDSKKKYFEDGVISKLNPDNCNAEVLLTKLDQPHSPFFFDGRCYVCSSGIASILSFDLIKKSLKLEYKGIDAYTRGLLVTSSFFYLGVSYSLGRTNSKYANPTFGILRFNRLTGETRHIDIPKYCDNVYSIIGIN